MPRTVISDKYVALQVGWELLLCLPFLLYNCCRIKTRFMLKETSGASLVQPLAQNRVTSQPYSKERTAGIRSAACGTASVIRSVRDLEPSMRDGTSKFRHLCMKAFLGRGLSLPSRHKASSALRNSLTCPLSATFFSSPDTWYCSQYFTVLHPPP